MPTEFREIGKVGFDLSGSGVETEVSLARHLVFFLNSIHYFLKSEHIKMIIFRGNLRLIDFLHFFVSVG